MLTELSFMKSYRTLCVSIIELQINYKISFKEAVQQFKSQKKFKKKFMMKRNRFALWICNEIVRKIPTLKTSSTSIRKIAQNFVITPPPFFMTL